MTATILSEYGALPVKAQRIAEIIQDYDPTLELRWIPPNLRTNFDLKPFSIWQDAPGTPPYMVMAIGEDELDHRVLAALFNANNHNGNVLDKLEKEETAKRLLALKETMDYREEQEEFALWAIRQNKTVQHNGVRYE